MQTGAHDFRPDGVAFIRGEFAPGEHLEVGRLDFQQQGVAEDDRFIGKKTEAGPHAQQRKVGEGFFGIDHVGVAEHAVGAADLVGHHVRIHLEEFASGVLLVFGDLGDHAFEPADNRGLAFAERGLV